jgi:hypothetical protein
VSPTGRVARVVAGKTQNECLANSESRGGICPVRGAVQADELAERMRSILAELAHCRRRGRSLLS